MKKILILGGGTAGTMVANHISKKFPSSDVSVTVVDRDIWHYYQPGFLFIPFGIYNKERVRKKIHHFLPKNVCLLHKEVATIEGHDNKVKCADGETISYDYLIIATGCRIDQEETPGMLDA